MPQNPFTIAAPVFPHETGRKLIKAVLQNARQLLFYFRPAETLFWKKKADDSAFWVGSKKDLPQFLFYIPKKLIYNGDGEM